MDQVAFYVEGKDSNVEIAWECGCSNMTGWECNLNIVGWFHLEQVNNVSDCFDLVIADAYFFNAQLTSLLVSYSLSPSLVIISVPKELEQHCKRASYQTVCY